MKKTSILIAIVTIIAAASATMAKDAGINFDGRTMESGTFSEAIAEIPVPGINEVPLPLIVPGLPDGDIAPTRPPVGCTLYCHYGLEDNCTCIEPWLPYPWEQPGVCQTLSQVGPWYELARCSPPAEWDQMIAGAQGRGESAALARVLQPALQQKLRDILLGYCDSYPEFAEVVLPILKDDGAKITIRDGFVYIISGNSIIRFRGKANEESGKESSLRKPGPTGLQYVDAFIQAGASVYNAVQSWNEHSSYPPVPDSGSANDYHGPALTVNPNDPDLQSFPSRKRMK